MIEFTQETLFVIGLFSALAAASYLPDSFWIKVHDKDWI